MIARIRFGAVLLLFLLVPRGTWAQAADGAPSAPARLELPALTPAWFDLTVNEVPKGQVLLRLGGGDAWIADVDLEKAGLSVEGGARLAQGERSLVSLRSLAPGITFRLDEEETSLRISASQTALGHSRLDLNPRPRPGQLSRREVPTAFANLGGRVDDWELWTASSEVGFAAGAGVLLSAGSWTSDAGFLRGLTVGHWDDAERLVRYSAGEFYTTTGDPLAGSPVLLGLSAGREWSLDPYVLRDPYPRSSVFVSTPSTLEVWVGDTLVRRTRVEPGTLDLENLPLYSGVNEVRTILRDSFGREQSLSTFMLMGTNLLAPGLVDWGVSAGVERIAELDGSIRYSTPTVVGRYRAGINRVLTLGARGEATTDLVNLGVMAGGATRVGNLELGLGASQAGRTGGAAYLTWQWAPLRRLSFVTQLRLMSDRYATTSLAASSDRALARGLLGVALTPAPGLSLQGELMAWHLRDKTDGLRASLRTSWAFTRGQQLGLTASRSRLASGDSAWDLLASWSMQLPNGHAVEVGAGTGSAGESAWLTAARSLGVGPGVGYRVQGRAGDGTLAEAELRGQSTVGWGAFTEQWMDPERGVSSRHEALEAATGLVLIDGTLEITRPVEGSYALLVLPGAPNVHVTLDGQPVGTTDRSGKLFVPGLLPYYGNRLAIRDADLPLDFKVNEVERYVAPRFRGGTVERFDVGPTTVVTGRIVLALDEKGTARDVAPEWGEVAVELPTGRVVSPIGTGGEFWLEGLTPGRLEALVRWEGRLCRFTFDVQPKPGVVNVGLLRCVQMLAAGDGDGVGGAAERRP